MPRRSSRLAAKKKVNYGEDALWYRALGQGKDAWNEMIQTVADDPPPVQKPWQKKKLFQKKPKPPKKKKKILKRTKARIEQDEKEIDYINEVRIKTVDELGKTTPPKRFKRMESLVSAA